MIKTERLHLAHGVLLSVCLLISVVDFINIGVTFFQEAEKHAKELKEEEERRKDRTARNKRKKLVSTGIIIIRILKVGVVFFPRVKVIHKVFLLFCYSVKKKRNDQKRKMQLKKFYL